MHPCIDKDPVRQRQCLGLDRRVDTEGKGRGRGQRSPLPPSPQLHRVYLHASIGPATRAASPRPRNSSCTPQGYGHKRRKKAPLQANIGVSLGQLHITGLAQWQSTRLVSGRSVVQTRDSALRILFETSLFAGRHFARGQGVSRQPERHA